MGERAIWITKYFLRVCERKRRDPKQVFLNENLVENEIRMHARF